MISIRKATGNGILREDMIMRKFKIMSKFSSLRLPDQLLKTQLLCYVR